MLINNYWTVRLVVKSDISKMNMRITFNTLGDPPVKTDDTGAEVDNLVLVKTVWAEKIGLSDRTFYQAATTNSESDVKFKIRYNAWVTSDMIITNKQGNIYYQKGEPIDPDNTRKFLMIHASTIKPAGR